MVACTNMKSGIKEKNPSHPLSSLRFKCTLRVEFCGKSHKRKKITLKIGKN